MEDLTLHGKIGLLLLFYGVQTNFMLFGMEININLLFWGAFGQVFALIVTYSEMEENYKEAATIWGVARFFANLVKGAVFSLMATERIAAWLNFDSIYIVAFFLGCFFDLLWPVLVKRFKKYINEKAII